MGVVNFIDGLSEIKSAIIDHGALGDNTIIPSVSGKRIAVMGVMVTSIAANTIQFFDGPSVDAIPKTGNSTRQAGEGYVLGVAGHQAYWFILKENSPLVLELTAANQTNGIVTYREIN